MAAGTRREWTTRERRWLLNMRARRMPVRDIAIVLGRTENAIHSFLRYVPVKPKRVAPQRIEKPARSPSEQLRDATLRAIFDHARRANLDVDTAAKKLLSEGVA